MPRTISHSQSYGTAERALSTIIADVRSNEPSQTDKDDLVGRLELCRRGIPAGSRAAMFGYLLALREQFLTNGMTNIVQDIDVVLRADGVDKFMDCITSRAPLNKVTAIELGRSGGLKGGKARAAKMTKEERSACARNAAQKRWGRRGAVSGRGKPEITTAAGQIILEDA